VGNEKKNFLRGFHGEAGRFFPTGKEKKVFAQENIYFKKAV